MKDIERIDKYPAAIEGNRVACLVWDSLLGSEGLTRTTLKKEIYLKLLKDISKYKDIDEVICELQTKGLIAKKTISKEFEVLVTKENGENYVTGEKN